MATKVIETKEYGKFKFLTSNREQSRGHIETLKAAFQEIGNLTRVQPILVNEKMQIIDGQHRFTAAQELDQPIFYTVYPGLGVVEARSMNILHRNWKADDYARSYALSGYKSYRQYLGLKEDYGFGHSVILAYVENIWGKSRLFKDFREGNFVMQDIDKAVDRLENLSEAVDKAPIMAKKPLAISLLRFMQSEEYNHTLMLKKLEKYGYKLVKVDDVETNLRQLEDIYNHGVSLTHRVRLY